MSLVVLAVAVAASVATSPAYSELHDRGDGAGFVLSPTALEATAEVELAASRATFRRGPRGDLDVGFEAAFSDLPAGVRPTTELIDVTVEALPAPGRAGTIAPVPGTPYRSGGGWSCRLTGDDDPCAPGRYRVTFRWPEAITTGSVHLDWHAEARLAWDRGSPPRGAELRVAAHGPVSADDAGRVVLHEGELTSPHDAVDVEVEATVASDLGRVRIEVPVVAHPGWSSSPDDAPGDIAVLASDERTTTALHVGTSSPIGAPTCGAEGCRTRVRLVPAHERAPIPFRLTADHLGAKPRVTVVAATGDVPATGDAPRPDRPSSRGPIVTEDRTGRPAEDRDRRPPAAAPGVARATTVDRGP